MAEKAERRFTRPRRLLVKSDFDRVFKKGRRSGAGGLTVIVLAAAGEESRLGVSISRKFGKAVARNRARRLLREAFRHVRPDLAAPLDLVVLPRAGHFPDRRALVEDQLRAALRRATRPRTGSRDSTQKAAR